MRARTPAEEQANKYTPTPWARMRKQLGGGQATIAHLTPIMMCYYVCYVWHTPALFAEVTPREHIHASLRSHHAQAHAPPNRNASRDMVESALARAGAYKAGGKEYARAQGREEEDTIHPGKRDPRYCRPHPPSPAPSTRRGCCRRGTGSLRANGRGRVKETSRGHPKAPSSRTIWRVEGGGQRRKEACTGHGHDCPK